MRPGAHRGAVARARARIRRQGRHVSGTPIRHANAICRRAMAVASTSWTATATTARMASTPSSSTPSPAARGVGRGWQRRRECTEVGSWRAKHSVTHMARATPTRAARRGGARRGVRLKAFASPESSSSSWSPWSNAGGDASSFAEDAVDVVDVFVDDFNATGDDEEYDVIARRMETKMNDAFAALEMRTRRVRERRELSSTTSVASAERALAAYDLKLRQAIATKNATIARAENLEEQLRVALDATREAHAELQRERARNLEEEIARANKGIRAELERVRLRAKELERALTESLDANETAIGIIADLRDEIDASRARETPPPTTTSGVSFDGADIADIDIDIATAHAIEAHIIWRRRVARGEPGDARGDWARAQAVVDDLTRSSSSSSSSSPPSVSAANAAVSRAFLENVIELIVLGDVSAFDHKTWSVVARALRRR